MNFYLFIFKAIFFYGYSCRPVQLKQQHFFSLQNKTKQKQNNKNFVKLILIVTWILCQIIWSVVFFTMKPESGKMPYIFRLFWDISTGGTEVLHLYSEKWVCKIYPHVISILFDPLIHNYTTHTYKSCHGNQKQTAKTVTH